MQSRSGIRCVTGAAIAGAILLLGACGIQIPSDPGGTLDRISGETLRAGASPDGTLVVVTGDEVSGALAELVEGFARTRAADVEWTVASEETLVTDLEARRLDLAVGGATDSSPWADRVAITRGYDGIVGADGRTIVFLLPMGENALQSALEAYLDAQVAP